MSRGLQAGCVLAAMLLAGCTNLEPLQMDVAALKSQVAQLQSVAQSAKQGAEQADGSAQSASQAAAGAQSTANQAMAAAQSSHACCDTTNEKIDRMFRRSVSK
jgi:murein lipoprotein